MKKFLTLLTISLVSVFYLTGCISNTDSDSTDAGGVGVWETSLATGAPEGRSDLLACWTGTHMLVWGGSYYDSELSEYVYFESGGLYDPQTDSWTATASLGSIEIGKDPTRVWTGLEMIVWGGKSQANGASDNTIVNVGAAYNPTTNSWRQISDVGAPAARQEHVAVWTGTEMVVWGGLTDSDGDGEGDGHASDVPGGRYNPSTDSWLPMTTVGELPPRSYPNSVAMDGKAFIWGGAYPTSGAQALDYGGTYDPSTDTWGRLSSENLPKIAILSEVQSTGDVIVHWGGWDGDERTNTGRLYDPVADEWTATSTASAPVGRSNASSVWNDHIMMVFGGALRGGAVVKSGGVFHPDTNEWKPTNRANAPFSYSHASVWTGNRMLVWGGESIDPSATSASTSTAETSNTVYSFNPYAPVIGTSAVPATPKYSSLKVSWSSLYGSKNYELERSDDGVSGWTQIYSGATASFTQTDLTPETTYYYRVRGELFGVDCDWSDVFSGTTEVSPIPAPSTPGNLMVVAGTPDTSALDVSWSSSATATSYELQRSDDGMSGWAQVYMGDQLMFSDSGLNDNATYFYRVRASSVNGNSDWSDAQSEMTVMLPPPAAPTGLAVAQGSPSISVLDVSWDTTNDATGYELERSDDGTTGWAQVYMDAANSYSDTGLAEAETKHYRVRVTTATGTSDWSSVESGTTGALPALPMNLSVVQGTPAISVLDVSWDSVTGATSYQVQRSDDGTTGWSQVYNDTTNSFSDTGLAENTTRHYRVRATNAHGSSAYSSAESATTDTTTPSGPWTATATTGAPVARESHTAIWTGNRMIVWGGDQNGDTGGIFDPATNSWDSATSTTGAPIARNAHTAVWTGSQMIIWGGFNPVNDRLNTGGVYTPGTDSWTATTTTSAPAGREFHTAIWTGTEMIVWGGWTGTQVENTGGRYNPSTDTWTPISTTNAPVARMNHTAVWTGTEMVIWGGLDGSGGSVVNTGARYNPNTNTWTTTSTTNAPSARDLHTAVWTGTRMIVWGGAAGFSAATGGASYDPVNDTWTAISSTNTPTERWSHRAVWNGAVMMIYGGTIDGFTGLASGGYYNPTSDSWFTLPSTGGPGERLGHSMLWTPSGLVVWGGSSNFNPTNTGSIYFAP